MLPDGTLRRHASCDSGVCAGYVERAAQRLGPDEALRARCQSQPGGMTAYGSAAAADRAARMRTRVVREHERTAARLASEIAGRSVDLCRGDGAVCTVTIGTDGWLIVEPEHPELSDADIARVAPGLVSDAVRLRRAVDSAIWARRQKRGS